MSFVGDEPWKMLVPLDGYLSTELDRKFHPLAAMVIPNSRAAWLRFLRAKVLLELIPLLPRIVRRHSGGPLDFISSSDFAALPPPTDPFTGEAVRLEAKPGSIRFVIGPIKGGKGIHKEFKEDTVVFEHPQTPLY